MQSNQATDIQKLKWLKRYKYTEREITKLQDRLQEFSAQRKEGAAAGISCYEYRPEKRTPGAYKDPTARAVERIEDTYNRVMDLLRENFILFNELEKEIEGLPTETARRVYRKNFFNVFKRPETPRENGRSLTAAQREAVLLDNLKYIEIPHEYLNEIPESQRGF